MADQATSGVTGPFCGQRGSAAWRAGTLWPSGAEFPQAATNGFSSFRPVPERSPVFRVTTVRSLAAGGALHSAQPLFLENLGTPGIALLCSRSSLMTIVSIRCMRCLGGGMATFDVSINTNVMNRRQRLRARLLMRVGEGGCPARPVPDLGVVAVFRCALPERRDDGFVDASSENIRPVQFLPPDCRHDINPARRYQRPYVGHMHDCRSCV